MSDTVFDGGGKVKPRKPSFRGRAMYDVSRGVLRVRGWPKKRGTPKSQTTRDQMEWFRQAQWATKFWPPEIVTEITQAVRGTPLLPRDIMTMQMSGRMFMISTSDGRKIYPVVAMTEVSESLDVISQVPGAMLIRGESLWFGLLPGPSGYVLTSAGEGLPPQWTETGGGSGDGYDYSFGLTERLQPLTSQFTWENSGTYAFSQTDLSNGLHAMIEGSTGGPIANNHGVRGLKDAPTGDFSIVAQFSLLAAKSACQAGIVLKDVTTNRMQIFAMGQTSADPRSFRGQYANWTYSSDADLVTWRTPSVVPYWIRVDRVGSNLHWYVGADGTMWEPVASFAANSWVASIDKIGMGLTTGSVGSAPAGMKKQIGFACHHWSVTP